MIHGFNNDNNFYCLSVPLCARRWGRPLQFQSLGSDTIILTLLSLWGPWLGVQQCCPGPVVSPRSMALEAVLSLHHSLQASFLPHCPNTLHSLNTLIHFFAHYAIISFLFCVFWISSSQLTPLKPYTHSAVTPILFKKSIPNSVVLLWLPPSCLPFTIRLLKRIICISSPSSFTTVERIYILHCDWFLPVFLV